MGRPRWAGHHRPVRLARLTDELDRRLLDLLRADGRASYAALGERLHLSAAAVRRRMARLQDDGVIKGYTVVVDEAGAGGQLQAIIEMRFAGSTSAGEIESLVSPLDGVEAVFTMAGDPDAFVWLRVPDTAALRTAVDRLRHSHGVRSTKTLMVLGDWHRGDPPTGDPPTGSQPA